MDTASNSGLVEITYDTEALTLVDVKEHAAYHSTVKADGSVVLAYADLEALDTLATLTFAAKTTDDTVVHIATKHLNDQKPAYDEANDPFLPQTPRSGTPRKPPVWKTATPAIPTAWIAASW